MGELCLQGYLDAARFLEENGMFGRGSGCAPFMGLGEPEVGVSSGTRPAPSSLPVVLSPLVSPVS